MQISQTPPRSALSQTWAPSDSPIIALEPAFTDNRGGIQPLVDEPMQSAVLITSKKGTVRANHVHHTDWHYCYVLSGSIEYHHRPVGSDAAPTKVIIGEREMFFTPPLVEHAMVFLEDTEFLCLGRNSREQTSYEADITRVQVYPFKA